ncbi:auxin efflux carrier [Earliella scabrosa]|nr:auxin efflux carrier [Earliella scabrosa]
MNHMHTAHSPGSSPSTLLSTFSGAFQGSLSVLLTLLAGYLMARRGYLTHQTVRHVSRLCTTLFLPCLILASMGPTLTLPNLATVWIVPLWGLASTLLAHALGYAGKRALRLPYWTVAACGRPNSNALPLLLLQSLATTGVLDTLSESGEPVAKTLGRAKSLVLLNAVVQQSLTFQLAPSIMARDDDDARGKDDDDDDLESQDRLRPGPGRMTSVAQDPERVGLLHDHDHDRECDDDDEQSDDSEETRAEQSLGRQALDDIADRPDIHWPERLRVLERPLKKTVSSISPPLLGAILALVIGITPPLHHAILDEDGALYSSVTQSIENLGELFVVLQTFIVGAELAIVRSSNPGVLSTSWVLLVRFIIMPALALLFVWGTAGRGLYVDDKLVWFLLVLIPAGPSAMLLVTVAELVDISQGAIAGYLTIAYLISPVMAVVCSLGLSVVESAASRVPGL